MSKPRFLILVATGAGLLAVIGAITPQNAAAQQGRSIDDELLEDLGGDPLEELDRELFGPDTEQGRAGESDTDGPEGLPPPLRGEPGEAAVPQDDNPLLQIARRMREVEGLIGRSDSGPGTQKRQQQIVADLEELIKQARKNCRKCGSGTASPSPQTASRRPVSQPKAGPSKGGEPASSKPVRRSTAQAGTSQPRRPDMLEMRDLIKRLWGELPQREREQMLQLPIDEFLPKYEQLIEQYFRRMLEEERGGMTNDK